MEVASTDTVVKISIESSTEASTEYNRGRFRGDGSVEVSTKALRILRKRWTFPWMLMPASTKTKSTPDAIKPTPS